jgi:hypothetical protein
MKFEIKAHRAIDFVQQLLESRQETDTKRASFQRRQISTGQKFWNEME